MNIAVIDADLIGRKKHRFPNLACMKISGYHKEIGDFVELKTDYEDLNSYDKVFISKVFTDTPFDSEILKIPNVEYGGTGFYFDKAPGLPYEIEHHMPDYNLYNSWISNEINKKKDESDELEIEFDESKYARKFKEYTDYSIGFITRGCFRKCGFCVNQKYDHVFQAAESLHEFYVPERKNICLLDDNFLGYPKWRECLESIFETNKKFKFKQGLDERLLTDEKCKLIFNSNYDGDVTFAFDSIKDYELIHKKLQMIRNHTETENIMFYVLVGYESTDVNDIENCFKRIELLMRYQCKPYIMRYMDKNSSPWKQSKFKGLYTNIARWCNQKSFIKTMSFKQFCEENQKYMKSNKLCSAMRSMIQFEEEYPDIAKRYFDMNYKDYK